VIHIQNLEDFKISDHWYSGLIRVTQTGQRTKVHKHNKKEKQRAWGQLVLDSWLVLKFL
jgi:hypothetical protein